MTQTSTEEQIPKCLAFLFLLVLFLLDLQEPLCIEQLFKFVAHVELVVQAGVRVDVLRLHFDCWGEVSCFWNTQIRFYFMVMAIRIASRSRIMASCHPCCEEILNIENPNMSRIPPRPA
jgi:hypothetical protein